MLRLPPATAPLSEYIAARQPAVFPGLAAEWPAVRRWDFGYLAGLRPELPIELVRGDRESAATHFTASTLGTYLESLAHDDPGAETLYLKEFDLLRRFPQLQADISPRKRLFPPRVVSPPPGVWVGPAGARTGAHYDLLGNIAIVIRGHKCFRLAPPGFVEEADSLSTKYDPWARLSALPLTGIPAESANPEQRVYEIELAAGDVLYVPEHWWHEVHNRSASILLSGFFGTYHHVARCAMQVAARHILHLAHLDRRTACTCHETDGR